MSDNIALSLEELLARDDIIGGQFSRRDRTIGRIYRGQIEAIEQAGDEQGEIFVKQLWTATWDPETKEWHELSPEFYCLYADSLIEQLPSGIIAFGNMRTLIYPRGTEQLRPEDIHPMGVPFSRLPRRAAAQARA